MPQSAESLQRDDVWYFSVWLLHSCRLTVRPVRGVLNSTSRCGLVRSDQNGAEPLRSMENEMRNNGTNNVGPRILGCVIVSLYVYFGVCAVYCRVLTGFGEARSSKSTRPSSAVSRRQGAELVKYSASHEACHVQPQSLSILAIIEAKPENPPNPAHHQVHCTVDSVNCWRVIIVQLYCSNRQ